MRQPHREAARGDDVLLHHRLQQLDHRRDAGDILRRIGREVGAAAGPDRVGDVAGIVDVADSISGRKSIPPREVAKWNCAGVSISTR